MLLRGLLIVLSLGEVYCTFVTINGTVKGGDTRVYYEPHTTTTLECRIDKTLSYDVIPEWTVDGSPTSDITWGRERISGNAIAIYTFRAKGTATVILQCRCASSQLPGICNSVKITLEVRSSSTSSSSTTTTHHTSSTTTQKPSTHGSGSTSNQQSTTKKPNKFKGVNPLIYTVIAVFLLGTLAVVAIVTCWIRARKTFYRRNRLPQFTTPRDYFEGISDSDFTPLTANQFYASLRDAPPTYHESEVIQASLREDQASGGPSDDQTPPPLPPRDHASVSRRNASPSGHGDSAQQDENHTLSPARHLDDETLLISSTALPTGSSLLPEDTLLL